MSKQRAKKARGAVGPAALSVLQRCVDGAQLSGFRRFPYPYTYAFGNANYVDAGDRVTKNEIATLVEAGYITASQSNPMADVIHYDVTPLGQLAAKKDLPAQDDSQLDWTKDGAA